MKQTKRLWITLLISMGVLCASAQQADYIVSGRACDRNVRTAIPFVRVSLVDADDSSAAYSCLSDGTGYFVFSHVKPGNYLLKISSLNYKTLLVPLEVMRHRMLDTLWMDTDPYSLKAVTVKEKRPIYTVDGEKNIYNVKEDPSVQAGTMADALQQAPGLEVDVEGNVSLRGMSDVEIRINDEPSHLTAITLKQYLKSMPASMVKRIEVIPNPSARYASSGGGIVNIVTTSPVNSSEFLSFGTGVASLPYVLPWITYVYSKKDLSLNVFGGCNYYFSDATESGYRHILTEEKLPYSEDSYSFTHKERNCNAFVGFTLAKAVDSLSTLMLYATGFPGKSVRDRQTENLRREFVLLPPEYAFSQLESASTIGLRGNGGFMYQRRLSGGRRLTGRGGANASTYSLPSEQQRIFETLPEKDVHLRLDAARRSIGTNLSVDYIHPCHNKAEWDLGASFQYNYQTDLKDYSIKENTETDFHADTVRSFHSEFHTSQSALYTTLQQQVWKLKVKAGLRMECQNLRGLYPSDPSFDFSRDYLSLLPSLHFSYQTPNHHHAFTMSYTRRCTPPGVAQLTSFVIYDLESFSVGNPELSKAFNHQLEAGWTRYFTHASVGLNAYYRATRNEIGNLSDVVYSDFLGRIVSFTQDVNIGDARRTGGELNLTYRPKPFLMFRVYARLFEDDYSYRFRAGETLERRMLSGAVRANVWAKWKIFELFASGNFITATQGLLYERASNKSIDCGMSADLFTHRMSVYVNAKDIFNWNRTVKTGNNPYYAYQSTSDYVSRYLAVGLTFRFGKMELERQARKGGTLDENNM